MLGDMLRRAAEEAMEPTSQPVFNTTNSTLNGTNTSSSYVNDYGGCQVNRDLGNHYVCLGKGHLCTGGTYIGGYGDVPHCYYPPSLAPYLITIILIILEVIFENLRSHMQYTMPRHYMAVTNAFLGELATLGFVSLLAFVVEMDTNGPHSSALAQMGASLGLGHSLHIHFEQLHFLLFGLSVAFIALALVVLYLSLRKYKKFSRWGHQVVEGIEVYHAMPKVGLTDIPEGWLSSWTVAQEREAFLRMFVRFVDPREVLPGAAKVPMSLNLGKYFEHISSHAVADMLQITMADWLALLLFALPPFLCNFYAPQPVFEPAPAPTPGSGSNTTELSGPGNAASVASDVGYLIFWGYTGALFFLCLKHTSFMLLLPLVPVYSRPITTGLITASPTHKPSGPCSAMPSAPPRWSPPLLVEPAGGISSLATNTASPHEAGAAISWDLPPGTGASLHSPVLHSATSPAPGTGDAPASARGEAPLVFDGSSHLRLDGQGATRGEEASLNISQTVIMVLGEAFGGQAQGQGKGSMAFSQKVQAQEGGEGALGAGDENGGGKAGGPKIRANTKAAATANAFPRRSFSLRGGSNAATRGRSGQGVLRMLFAANSSVSDVAESDGPMGIPDPKFAEACVDDGMNVQLEGTEKDTGNVQIQPTVIFLPRYIDQSHWGRRRARDGLRKFLFGRLGTAHERLLWFGIHGKAFMARIIRMLALATVVLPICAIIMFRERILCTGQGTVPCGGAATWQGICLLTLAILIPVTCAVIISSILSTFVIITSIELMKNRRAIEQVHDKAYARKAGEAWKTFSQISIMLEHMKILGSLHPKRSHHNQSFEAGHRSSTSIELHDVHRHGPHHSNFSIFREDSGGGGAGEIKKSAPSEDTLARHAEKLEKKKRNALEEMPVETRQYLQNLFDELDKDNSGQLDRDEMRELFLTSGVEHLDPDEEQYLFELMDEDGSGLIAFEEFAAVMGTAGETRLKADKTARRMFRLFDPDGRGYITAAEVELALRQKRPTFDSSHVVRLLKIMDIKRHGKVTLEQLTEYIKATVMHYERHHNAHQHN